MLYELVKQQRGKETVVMRDERTKVMAVKKQLQDSQRGMKVEYLIRESTEGEKKERKKHRFRSH